MHLPLDQLGRPLRNLRISVTDRCNLRCAYCMPEESYVWLPRADILTFEETERVVSALTRLGVERLRLTGGEPLLRRGLSELVAMLARVPGIRDLAMTTNALLLSEAAASLKAAGLGRLTISLDTLRPDRFRKLTRTDGLARALAGIEAAGAAGFRGTKLNCVVMRGVNDDEILDLVELGRAREIEVRFIEYMDVGGATRWSMDEVVPAAEILDIVGRRFGPVRPLERSGAPASPPPASPATGEGRGAAPAERFRLSDGTTIGIVASTTRPFCATCDRARVTADGRFYLCLYARDGLDLRAPLRAGAGPEELARLVREAWTGRADRGAEERLSALERGRLVDPGELRRDPHLEMHTRGG